MVTCQGDDGIILSKDTVNEARIREKGYGYGRGGKGSSAYFILVISSPLVSATIK